MYLFMLVNSSTTSRCSCAFFLARHSLLMKLCASMSYRSPHRQALHEFLYHHYLVYLASRRLKRSKCLEQKQAVGIYYDIVIKMIAKRPDTLAGTRIHALLSLCLDFLAHRSERVVIRSKDLKFTLEGTLKGVIRKSKTNKYGKGWLVFDYERSADSRRSSAPAAS